MTQMTLADVEAMQRGSSTAAELLKERAELIAEFYQNLSDIDGRIKEALGSDFLIDFPSPPSRSRVARQEAGQRRPSGNGRKERKRNRHALPWYILVAMQQEGGSDVSEESIVGRVLDMGYQSNADDFHNSVYTTLYTMQRNKQVKKSSEKDRVWNLTSAGVKQAQKNLAELEEEQKEEE